MASPRKIAANQQNAKLSTGPKSEAGKAASSMNHLKDGLYATTLVLPCEDPEAFQKLRDEYQAFYEPANVSEQEKVDQLTAAKWRELRASRIEHSYLCQHTLPDGNLSVEDRDIIMYSRVSQMVVRYHRLWQRLDRDLLAIKARRQPAQPAEKPAVAKPAAAEPKPAPQTLTKHDIANRDSPLRPPGMKMGAIEFCIRDGQGNPVNTPARIWNDKNVDEFPPEAYLQEGEIDPNPPQRRNE